MTERGRAPFLFSLFILTQRRRGRRVHTENYIISREMAEMAEIFPLFRYYSVSSVIDKDNSQSDWRKENMPHGLSAISAIWLPLKRRPLVLREIK